MMTTASRHRALARVLVFAVLASAALDTFAAQVSAPGMPWRADLPWVPNGGGGPDSFGYIWAVSTDPGGPTFDWIDISTTGTVVTGLADDNSANPIALPFSFRFYWTDINSIRIGSNGWIGLGTNVPNNIASCFPVIPTSGGAGDSYVAPLAGDLNFTGTGNPGQALYFIDQPNQRVIVSYLNVPYWIAAAPGFAGSNTFQVILDAVTRRIKFQYQGLAGFVASAGCIDLVGGIEAPQGQIGLQLFSDAQPPGNRAIEFTYPNPPLISVIDPTPSTLTTAGLGAVHFFSDTPAPLSGTVANDGDGATTSQVDARGRLFNGAVSLYDQTIAIPSLAGGASAPVVYASPPTVAPGHYRFTIDVTGGGDINPGNNSRSAELVAVAPGTTTFLDYVGTDAPGASLDWNGVSDPNDGTGLGILIVPPGPGYAVDLLGLQLSSNAAATVPKLKLVNNDGPNGTPLTVLGESLTPTGPNNTWIDVPITPVAVDTDGVYVLWIDRGTAFINLSITPPISRRSIEFFGGGYAAWRTNDAQDVFLRARFVSDVLFNNGFE